MNSSSNEYKDHIVAFIDLLGFKEAIKSGKQNDILELLTKFAAQKKFTSAIHAYGELQTFDFDIHAFSDNIVISYPLNKSEDLQITLFALTNFISYLAAISLQKGFLIRGGLAIGHLYCESGVLFGDALIEAYKMESEIANYPRVIISDNISDDLLLSRKIDKDGLRILDIYNYLLNSVVTPGDTYRIEVNKQMDIFDKIIETNLKKLKNNQKAYSKWIWFKAHYNQISLQLRNLFPLITEQIIK